MKVTLMKKDGSDLDVANIARVSYAKETFEFRDSEKRLVNYMAKHGHWSPFAHIGATYRIKAPIFVARQLVKHQVGFAWNETSRRYVDTPPEFYTPSVWRSRAETNKQGSSRTPVLIDHGAIEHLYGTLLGAYKALIDQGVAPEQARMVLPLSTYTEWIWSGSLFAFARMFKLRTDHHAQKETRAVAYMLGIECLRLFPYCWRALTKSE